MHKHKKPADWVICWFLLNDLAVNKQTPERISLSGVLLLPKPDRDSEPADIAIWVWVILFWWRWGESNPCPKTISRSVLRAQAVILDGVTALFPSQQASRHACRSGKSHDAWYGQLFPYARSLLNDALLKPQYSQVGRLPAIRQQMLKNCCSLIYKVVRF